jgi:hypothetical protein
MSEPTVLRAEASYPARWPENQVKEAREYCMKYVKEKLMEMLAGVVTDGMCQIKLDLREWVDVDFGGSSKFSIRRMYGEAATQAAEDMPERLRYAGVEGSLYYSPNV